MPYERTEIADVTRVDASTPFEILRGTFRRQRFAPHAHETWAIGTIEHGRSRVRFRGADVIHRAGDVVTIAPGEVHTGESMDDGGWTYRMFYVPRELMARCSGTGEEPRFAASGVHDPVLSAELVRVHALLEGGAPLDVAIAEFEAALAALCARHAIPPCGVRVRPVPPHVDAVRRYLDEHPTEPVRLASLAAIANIGTYHLIREFRRAFGLPPYMYLEVVRATRARDLLRQGVSPSGVAFTAGYSDQSHLTRQFKRIFGVTPGRYLRSCGRTPAVLAAKGGA